nr:putative membrane protein [Quercus suber]
MGSFLRDGAQQVLFLLALLQLFVAHGPLVAAVFIPFDNCIPEGIAHSSPLQLQFTPLYFDAKFDTARASHNLDITIYGNVSGQQVTGDYPPPDSPQWDDPTNTFGKIANTTGNITTLSTNFKVLDYEAWTAATVFCDTLVNGTCPLGPSFTQNASNPYDLPAFSISRDLGSSYAFSTLAGTIRVISGEQNAPTLACVSANVVPDLGPRITALLTWLPAGVLILKGIATLSAAIWSPWGSTDIFRWSSNYGRDEDLLRLVTPGFGDCLQYIQFVALTGAISLQYPGFYQPAVSQVAWSTLLFNESFVSHGNGTQSLADGVYSYNSTYGMTAMSQLIGMSKVEDVWACMAIWLLVIAAAVVVLCQLGFIGRWIYRTATHTTEEDLRQKNFPFTIGNMIRLLFNYFILPIVAISLYQLVIAGRSPAVVVAMAGLLLVIMILSAAWILRVIFKTKPRTLLFDDMPTVLMYGPLYNTYSDTAAPFALVPVFITFMRGVALGAIQPSGIAQIIVLAICEVILILTLNGFRPFQGQTSMNAYHTFFSVVRLITVLLSIAFVGTLGVSEATKGWIGYVILFLHACVLVFGFFLNAAQTLVEVIARAMGVGGDAQSGAIRGSILNIRMLKKRQDRPTRVPRGSMTSDAAILRDSEAFVGRRSRSISASSQQLLNQVGNGTPSVNRLSGFEAFSSTGDVMTDTGDHDPDGYGYLPAARGKLSRDQDRSETFYRPPRARRTTLDPLSPGVISRKGTVNGDFPYRDSPPDGMVGHLRSTSAENGVTPVHFRERQESNENIQRTDYAVREVDQYYRGPQLSTNPSRKLKTGPADPVGPAAHAQSWVHRVLFGAKNKSKEPSKGFEVVRSSRMPPGMQQQPLAGAADAETVEMQTSPVMHQEPYTDSPPRDRGGVLSDTVQERAVSPLDQYSPVAAEVDVDGKRHMSLGFGNSSTQSPPQVAEQHDVSRGLRPDSEAVPPILNLSQSDYAHNNIPDGHHGTTRVPRMSFETEASRYNRASSEYPESPHEDRLSGPIPVLQPIETVGGIDLPSRFNSRRSVNLDDIEIGDAGDANDWLRDVDNLHRSRSPPSQDAQPFSNPGLDQPFVPARSSLRPASQDYRNMGVAGQTLFQDLDSRDSATFMTNNTNDSATARHSQNQVRHHRAGDSITRNSFGANAALHASRAEVFGEPPPTEEDENGADADAVRFIRRP